jgi:cytochrome c peroxidase
MRIPKTHLFFCFLLLSLAMAFSVIEQPQSDLEDLYLRRVLALEKSLQEIEQDVLLGSLNAQKLGSARRILKAVDPMLRYLDPVSFKLINGPLPVEWETEVFEKWEPPYKRIGGGLTLMQIELLEAEPDKQKLKDYLQLALKGIANFKRDSFVLTQPKPWVGHYSNRLFLLNLATIYTTGFENPYVALILPELFQSLVKQQEYYVVFNKKFPQQCFTAQYLTLFQQAIQYVASQKNYADFNSFVWIKDFVNPLFALQQEQIRTYKLVSKNLQDYSLNNEANSIFAKNLYNGLSPKGVFQPVQDTVTLNRLAALGGQLFFDPILSGNLKRSCASCHSPAMAFTDNTVATALQFNFEGVLPRNTPTLLNASYNHLAMIDGHLISLQKQVEEVSTNPIEMGGNKELILKYLQSVDAYKKELAFAAKQTPSYPKPDFQHVASAITLFYSKHNKAVSSFDDMMNQRTGENALVVKGFNLFMSKAQCATCHFAPIFNGVKPPYTNSEFEVIGTPSDTFYSAISSDSGRYKIYPSPQSLHAFRTPTLRNISKTAPYMHNGVFKNLNQVMAFYNNGGGVGHGLNISNQTLSADSIGLDKDEVEAIIAFMKSLDEKFTIDPIPASLPISSKKVLNSRKPGGEY